MSYRRSTYPEVLDSLLTSVTAGVAAEAHPFPPQAGPPYVHNLLRPPVAEVVSIYGSRDAKPCLFTKDKDYKLSGNAIVWQDKGKWPDEGTVFQVNYYPAASQPVMTDIHTGSVLRTLTESIALEIGRLYAQLEMVYQAGFIDTATGAALDNVVALLDLERVKGGRPAGEIEFKRASGVNGVITIPAGTRIMTSDGSIEYETLASITMPAGQDTIRVMARDKEVNDGLAADMLTVLSLSVAGIAGVTNPSPTTLTTQDETDEQLRARAKNFLHGSERATKGAIEHAVARQGISAVVHEDKENPGYVTVTPLSGALSPEQIERLNRAIEDAKPAGVIVTLGQARQPKKLNLSLRLITGSTLIESDLRAIQRSLSDKLTGHFKSLDLETGTSVNRLIGLALAIPGLKDLAITEAVWEGGGSAVTDGTIKALDTTDNKPLAIELGTLSLADANLATKLNCVVNYPSGQAPPDTALMENALKAAATWLTDQAKSAAQEITYAKLLYALPLPGKSAGDLAAYAAAAAPDAAPYGVQFIISQESGLSTILSPATAASYILNVSERLSLATVKISPVS